DPARSRDRRRPEVLADSGGRNRNVDGDFEGGDGRALLLGARPQGGRDGPQNQGFLTENEEERAGFEPATHLSARTRFPVASLRPLGHLSARQQRSASR